MQEPLISGGLAFQEMGCVCVPWMVGKILLLTGRCQIFQVNRHLLKEPAEHVHALEWRGTTSMQHLVEPFLQPFSMQGP